MKLEELKIPAKKISILEKNGITSVESLLYKEPRKYYYFQKTYPLVLTDELKKLIEEKTPIAILGKCESVCNEYKNGKSLIKIKVTEKETSKNLYVNIIGQFQMFNYYLSLEGFDVIVGGKLGYSPEYRSFSMLNPIIFSGNIKKYNRIIPVYSKYKGISEEYYCELIQKALNEVGELDYVPHSLLKKCKLKSFKEAAKGFYQPSSYEEIRSSKHRKVFDDMLYFTCKLEEQSKINNESTQFVIKKHDITDQVIQELPFILTNGQKTAIYSMINRAMEGKRISSLVQGDVGSGKTIVAFCMMIAITENGFQSVLMAPTTVLAKQHYNELKEKMDKYGFHTVFLSNELKASEKKKVLAEIKSGKANFIVGTHSCVSKSVEYYNLGIAITDEEHKFGVLQRESLLEKAKEGVHNIIMSGTPIPRTLANTLYGNETEVYSMELPANRKPIQTAVCIKNQTVFDWLVKEINKGRQAYVVCPLIDKADEDSKMKGIASIEETYTIYKNYMSKHNIEVAVVTGKTPKQEQTQIIQDFKDNKIQILMATTVIEVGINNPNATVIVITGAERFGLATLHQLRGRVGRGEHKSYCILQKSPESNGGSNLEILCKQTDGLEIAKEDLKNRGTGNILGKEQSGKNKYIELLLEYPRMYEKVREIAHKLCQNHTGKDIIQIYENYYTLTQG